MEDRTIEGRIRHSIGALAMVISIVNKNPNKLSITSTSGKLKLHRDTEYLHITYTGRKEICKKL